MHQPGMIPGIQRSCHCSLCWKPNDTSTSGKLPHHSRALKFESWMFKQHTWQFCSHPTIYNWLSVVEEWNHLFHSFVGRVVFPVRMPWSCTSWPSQIVHSQCWWMKRWVVSERKIHGWLWGWELLNLETQPSAHIWSERRENFSSADLLRSRKVGDEILPNMRDYSPSIGLLIIQSETVAIFCGNETSRTNRDMRQWKCQRSRLTNYWLKQKYGFSEIRKNCPCWNHPNCNTRSEQSAGNFYMSKKTPCLFHLNDARWKSWMILANITSAPSMKLRSICCWDKRIRWHQWVRKPWEIMRNP